MTGVLTQEAFRNDIEAILLKKEQYITFTLVDLDKFKSFNDTYGHPAGDELLKSVAKGLEGLIQDQGLVCRMGGDEFAFALLCDANISVEQSIASVETIFNKVQKHIQEIGQGTTLSIGVSYSSLNEICTFNDLYTKADTALYESKDAGRHCMTVYEDK